MKIVLATPLYPPEIGGPATYSALLVEHLPKKGIEIVLVKFSDVRRLPKIIRHLVYFWRVFKAARGADAVLALDPVSVGLPAACAARLAQKPFIVKIVGDYAWEQGRQRFGVKQDLDVFVRTPQSSPVVRLFQKIQSRVARTASRIIVPSNYLKRILVAWGLRPETISVIYNSVSLESSGVVPETIAELPGKIICTAGRLVPWKNVEGVIDAVSMLREKYPDLSLVVIGDGPLRQVLQERAKEKLKTGYIFTGTLAHGELIATMRRADVFALNSSYEGLSHLLVEAVLLGKAVVATDIPGNAEVVQSEHNGLLVGVGKTQELAQAIGRFIADPELTSKFEAQNKEEKRRFSQETMIDTTVKVLQEVCNR